MKKDNIIEVRAAVFLFANADGTYRANMGDLSFRNLRALGDFEADDWNVVESKKSDGCYWVSKKICEAQFAVTDTGRITLQALEQTDEEYTSSSELHLPPRVKGGKKPAKNDIPA